MYCFSYPNLGKLKYQLIVCIMRIYYQETKPIKFVR